MHNVLVTLSSECRNINQRKQWLVGVGCRGGIIYLPALPVFLLMAWGKAGRTSGS